MFDFVVPVCYSCAKIVNMLLFNVLLELLILATVKKLYKSVKVKFILSC